MIKYGISMPISGFIYKELEAESKEEAKEKFYALEIKTQDISDWDMHEKIVNGNVFHGLLDAVIIEEV